MAGGGEMLFAGSGSVRVSMMPSISDEELAAILLTALD
jgi:hypothetical protein